jgi:cobaltochelatase CobT
MEPSLLLHIAFATVLVAIIAWTFLPLLRRSQPRAVQFDPDRPYQAYTHDFDAEIKADDLDAFLAALPDRHWAEKFPEVDPAELYNLEGDLAARRAGMETTEPQVADTIVSLLIDHSGSMRGQPMLCAARAALVASDLLDGVGAKHEVLGFTTTRWKGGSSREKWLSDGRPAYPGRLNDLLHVVYCNAGEKLGARHCALMLRRDLVKENIDGEALEWAASRLRRRQERQKVLIVLSDGAPVDDSTLLANGDGYLIHHLTRVTREIEQAGDITLAAIGIGYSVERYYRQGITIGSPEELEGPLVQLINQLLHPVP